MLTVLILLSLLFQFPSTSEDWQVIARNFESRWNFPNCGGSIDGKHIRIVQPAKSGSYFYNYKGYNSIVLMAIVNADYEFIYVSVGCNGRVSDGGVLETTTFYDKLMQGTLGLPSKESTKENMTFVFVADDAFALHEHIVKPFPQKNLTPDERIFNYRLSRARRTVENAFGILSNRFRVFHTSINMKPEKINYILLASCALHNFLRRHSSNSYLPKNSIDTEVLDTGDIIMGDWRSDHTLGNLQHGYGRNLGEPQEKRVWVKSWLRDREASSHMSLFHELRLSHHEDLVNYLRMSEENFQKLLNLVALKIRKMDTRLRQAVTVEERLTATLRFLTTGQSFEDQKFPTRISPQALGKIIPETCKQLYLVLKDSYLK
ncbi:uncharacterized protein [Leptinotarsa decemlineata]|uniref:uncharacterized protein n=1 Tax=Leptinotarsa decemlineata TaxID=7539 RepID=UPI003D30BABB